MSKVNDKEFLILELHRFYNENGRVPVMLDMQTKFGYPSSGIYQSHFDSWNNALEVAKLPLNQYHPELDGTEVCSYCGKRADEILNFVAWRYDKNDNKRYCDKHGKNSDYITGNLDINSSKGLGRAGEILVVKTLGIRNEYDCNRISCGYSFDMYHKDYGKIDVKTSLLSDVSNTWYFNLTSSKEVKTYICIGLSTDRSIVKHVWILPNEDEIRDKQGLTIYNTLCSLSNRKHWEVDAKPYNDVWQTMKLKTCNSMTDKSKPRVKLTWEEAVKKAAEIRKEIELKKLHEVK